VIEEELHQDADHKPLYRRPSMQIGRVGDTRDCAVIHQGPGARRSWDPRVAFDDARHRCGDREPDERGHAQENDSSLPRKPSKEQLFARRPLRSLAHLGAEAQKSPAIPHDDEPELTDHQKRKTDKEKGL
jgi:hypothetical protein